MVTGASGTGKTTLVKEALGVVPGLSFSVSATTRARRPGERDGVDYFFVDQERFDALLRQGAFLEWAEVYGNRYGTLRASVEESVEQGSSVLLDIDIQGARQVRRAWADAVTVFILPPTPEILEIRLHARSTDPLPVIERRVREAHIQLKACGEFDYLVVNDVLESAHDQFQAILVAELLRRQRRQRLVRVMAALEE